MRLQSFDLNLLRALDALLHERNVTRAAARRHLTQQAMSGALKRLRDHFDDELLVATGRKLQLTPLAAALVEPVRAAMLQVDQVLETRPTFDAASSERSFTLAMSDYAAVTLLPMVMAKLHAHAPLLKLDVRLIDKDVVRAVESGEVDLCLLPSDWSLFHTAGPRGVTSLALYEDDFVCVVGQAHWNPSDNLDEARYWDMGHTVLRLGGGVTSLVEAAWRDLRVAPRIAATSTSFANMVIMVSEAPLIATVQRRLAQKFARMLPICVLECPIPIKPLKASMSWRPVYDNDTAHKYLRDTFVAAAARNGDPAAPACD